MSAQRVATPGAPPAGDGARVEELAPSRDGHDRPAKPAGPGRRLAAEVARSPWLICAASTVLTAFGLLLYLQNRRVPGTVPFFDPVTPAAAAAFPALGAFIVARRPGDRIGLVLCSGALLGLSFFADQYAAYSLVTSPGSLPAARWLAWLGSWTWIPGFLIPRTLLLLLFPDGRPPTARWRPVVWGVGALIGATTLVVALVNLPPLGDPLAPRDLPHQVGLLLGPVALAGLLVRYRKTGLRGPNAGDSQERAQVRLLAWPAALGIMAPLLVGALVLFGGEARLSPVVYEAIGLVSLLGMLAAVWVAMVRYGLMQMDPYETDMLVSHSLVYAGLTVAVLATYLVTVRLLDAGVAGGIVSVRRGLATSLVGMAVVVVALHPLQRLVRRVVDRLRFDKLAAEALAGLGHRLESTLTPEAVLPAIVQTIASALKLPYVAVEIGHGDEVIASAAHGAPVENTVALELVHQNEQVGRLVIAPRTPRGRLDPAQSTLLHDLANQAGVAAYVVRLTSELRQSRSRVVAAADAERRRIERDLHDGAQQHLVALAINVRLAQTISEQDPRKAKELLDQVADDVRDTLQELRDLAHGIYPPLLTQRGLKDALLAAAGRSPLPTRVDCPGIGRYPPEVEAAVYFCCLEALQNAGKHAGPAATVTVRVWEEASELRFAVTDDGAGFDSGHRGGGQGLANMGDRLGAIGGTLRVTSQPGAGTTVSGCIPLSRE